MKYRMEQRENPKYRKKEVKGMSDKSGYVGKIGNTGTQVVKAPHQTTLPKKGTVKTGKDMRTKGK